MIKYRTKYGLELLGFLLLVFGFMFYIAQEELLMMFFVMVPVMVFIALVLFSIRYTVDENILTVHSAFFVKTKIDIKTIRKIRESNNPLSSPAGSMDRLEVQYGNKYDSILISPANTDDFIQHLLSINPAIEVHKKPGKNIFAKLAV